MDREQARETAREMIEDYLRGKGIKTNKPFICLNPHHSDKHPSMSLDRKNHRVKCFSCGASYDIFDLIGIEYGLTDVKEIFDQAYQILNIQIDAPIRAEGDTKKVENQKQAKAGQNADTREDVYTNNQESKPNFDQAIEAAHTALLVNAEAMRHYTARGLTEGIIKQYKLGYAPQGQNSLLQAYPQYQTQSKKAPLYRYVFPCFDENGTCTYFQTEIADRTQIDDYNGKYRKINKMETPLFNERYLKKDTPSVIFVAEGLYDVYSIEMAGGRAVAVQGAGGDGRFLRLCKAHKPDTTFILYTDTDKAGEDFTEKIANGLKALSIPYMIHRPKAGKDANDEIVADREAFTERIQQIIAEAAGAKDKEAEEAKAAYLATNTGAYLQQFIAGIGESVNTSAIPTGFLNLDAALDGGLYEGLYVMGAISSLGKTTFIMQVADSIAASGRDVLIFSLEMARSELMSKSISRHTLQISIDEKIPRSNAKTARGITDGKRYANYSKVEKDLVQKAIQKYGEYAENLFIKEGVGNIGAEQIRETVEKHIRYTGRRPLVVVDYLQILAPYSERATDKQSVDKSVLELKRISRDYKIPVVAISSFNRNNYSVPVAQEAFKESGSVEYSSDVLLGLQLAGTGSKDFDATAEKKKDPRAIELVILKNRQGRVGDKIRFDYYPMFNYFMDKGKF